MLEISKKAAVKFGIDTKLIEKRTNTNRNIRVLGNDLTFLSVRESERTKYKFRRDKK